MGKAQGATVCPEGDDFVFLWQNVSSRGDAHWTLSKGLLSKELSDEIQL